MDWSRVSYISSTSSSSPSHLHRNRNNWKDQNRGPLLTLSFSFTRTHHHLWRVASKAAPLNSLQQFRVILQEGIPKADLAVTITSPSGSRIKAHVIPTAEGFLVNFTPTQLGEYLLSISFGGTPISPRPFHLQCLTGSDSRKVSAVGPGLERGIVGMPAEFRIDTRGAGQGGLGVTVEGPCEAAINCRDNGDGTCNVAYLPTEVGDYSINVTFNEEHIAGSPFQALIMPQPNLQKTKVSGIGIQPHGNQLTVVRCRFVCRHYYSRISANPPQLLVVVFS